jgi:enoyl-CoA hydratase
MADENKSAQADLYETIKVETSGRVGVVHLHRPNVLNALNAKLSHELLAALRTFDQDETIGAMIITGSERAFAAGADIAEMARKTPVQLRNENYFGAFDEIAKLSKPIIAAVSGYAASSLSFATSSSRRRVRNSGNRRSNSALCRP